MYRYAVGAYLEVIHRFAYEELNSREWRMVDRMRIAGRSVEYAGNVVRRANRMRKARNG